MGEKSGEPFLTCNSREALGIGTAALTALLSSYSTCSQFLSLALTYTLMRKLFGGPKRESGQKLASYAHDDSNLASSFAGMQIAPPTTTPPHDPYSTSRENILQTPQQQSHRHEVGRRKTLSRRKSTDDNWELLQASDYRQDSLGSMQKPQAPALTQKTSSMSSLPPGASPPNSAQLVPPASSPYSSVPVDSSGFSTIGHSSNMFNVLRKKTPSMKETATIQQQQKATSAILRALDPHSPKQEREPVLRDSQALATMDSSDILVHSDVDHDRDRESLDVERQRRLEERDREIKITQTPRKRVFDESSIDQGRQGATRREKAHLDGRDTRRRKDSSSDRSGSAERGRTREHVREKDHKEEKRPQWTSLFSFAKDRPKGKEHEHDSPEEQLTRMMGS